MLLKRFFFMLIIISIAAAAHAGKFKVIRVYDGDTLKAIGHDIEIKVRLAGIDAPETKKGKRKPGQPFSERSKKLLASMVLNKTIDIKGFGLGPFNRIIGVIFINNINVNLRLVEQGLAEVYQGRHPRGFNTAAYKQVEIEARSSKRGMWGLGSKYISPKIWRKRNK